jgi:1,4-dihydroxy-2-naphthoate octaprenyltransferase
MYSHPTFRFKKYPLLSFLIVFIFQGAFVYWSTYASISGLNTLEGWNFNFTLAGLICSCLIGATYPLTQVYQHEEDSNRGDKTLSIVLGIRGSFYFSALLFLCSSMLLYFYWDRLEMSTNFWIFLALASPVFILFSNWFFAVYRDPSKANFKNGVKDGEWVVYYNNGNIYIEMFYSNGVLVSGKRWDENGTLIEER